jgi:hypothetical protein
MTNGISIDTISVDVDVEHPRRRGPAEIGSIHVQIHDSGILVWDEWCRLCSDDFSYDAAKRPWIRDRDITEFAHFDALFRYLAEQRAAHRSDMVGAYLEPAMRAMEDAIARRNGSSVYFADAGGQIKIGWSRKVAARLAQLQTGSASPIKLLGTIPGGRGTERRLHERFAHLRLSGEWFVAAPELLAYIAEGRTSETEVS